jgi:hypothetical protein
MLSGRSSNRCFGRKATPLDGRRRIRAGFSVEQMDVEDKRPLAVLVRDPDTQQVMAG